MKIYLFERFKCEGDEKIVFCVIGVQFRSEYIYMISLELKPVLMNRGTGDGPSRVVE